MIFYQVAATNVIRHNKVTVPREPVLETSRRAQRRRYEHLHIVHSFTQVGFFTTNSESLSLQVFSLCVKLIYCRSKNSDESVVSTKPSLHPFSKAQRHLSRKVGRHWFV